MSKMASIFLAAKMTRDRRGRKIFQKLATEEVDHLTRLEGRYRDLLKRHPDLETQPTFLFFKGAADGLFASGTRELEEGADDREALRIGIRCELGSHQFFKRYGEQFEESDGKRVFLEFADEERAHLELLQREYRVLSEQHRRRPRQGRRRRST